MGRLCVHAVVAVTMSNKKTTLLRNGSEKQTARKRFPQQQEHIVKLITEKDYKMHNKNNRECEGAMKDDKMRGRVGVKEHRKMKNVL